MKLKALWWGVVGLAAVGIAFLTVDFISPPMKRFEFLEGKEPASDFVQKLGWSGKLPTYAFYQGNFDPYAGPARRQRTTEYKFKGDIRSVAAEAISEGGVARDDVPLYKTWVFPDKTLLAVEKLDQGKLRIVVITEKRENLLGVACRGIQSLFR